MARIRTIKPEFFDDEEIAALSFPARLAFIGLWQQADREGRLRDRPVRLKARIFPFDDVDMVALLDELEVCRFIRRYSVDGEALISVRTFERHQVINAREAQSVLPAPDHRLVSVHAPAVSVHALGGKERKGREQEGKGTKESPEPSNGSGPPMCASPTILDFPVVGVGGPTWGLTEAQLAEWAELFPTLDVQQEARHALAWVQANPGRRKTTRGMPKFMVGWLTRSVDRGTGNGHGRGAAAPAVRAVGPAAEAVLREMTRDRQ